MFNVKGEKKDMPPVDPSNKPPSLTELQVLVSAVFVLFLLLALSVSAPV
jgi:hypothetical protein